MRSLAHGRGPVAAARRRAGQRGVRRLPASGTARVDWAGQSPPRGCAASGGTTAIEPGTTLDHYRLIEKIGAGGMGVVWRALDLSLNREVALKLLPDELAADPTALALFEREARAVAALNHPGIVTIHSVEEACGIRFLTLELLSGRTLQAQIPPDGMPLDRLLEVAVALADALAAAHDRGIVHRDLKPSNVMVTDDGRVKIMDFGLAKIRRPGGTALRDDRSTVADAREAAFAGTLHYMSPEQIRGQSVDQASDLFAMGVLLYEMAVGRRPFGGETVHSLTASILLDAPVPPSRVRPELPRRLDEIVSRCVEKDRSIRLCSARELHGLLVELRGGLRSPVETGTAPSIAVLPFSDLSQEKDQRWFCDGIAEEIITTLARPHALRVASRISSFSFRDTPLDGREIGRRLRVRHLVAGSVRKMGDRLRIAIELTDVEAGFCLWSERYDRSVQDIFRVQEEIAQGIVQALQLRMSPSELEALGHVSTTDVAAYEYYLKGRMYFYQYNRRGIEFARQMFTAAIEQDPGYALAHAGLADCCTFIFMHVLGREEVREAALAAGRRAVELEPETAQTHVSLGLALSLTRDHPAAEREFEEALRLDPQLFEAHYFYARDSFMQGNLEKALRLYERAFELRPEDYQSPLLMGQIYEDLKQREQAEIARRRGIQAAGKRLALHPDDVRALYMGANGLVALGERERGLEWARRALALDPDDAMLLYNLACIFSIAGEREAALDYLERSVRAGMNRPAWVRNDSNLDAIRDDPRFTAVLRTLEETYPAA